MSAAMPWRLLILLAGFLCLLVAAFLPVERIVAHAIPQDIVRQILDRGTPERVTELQTQFRTGLIYLRIALTLLGGWLLLIAGSWRILIRWSGEVEDALSNRDGPASNEISVKREIWFPVVWAVIVAVMALPLLPKGFDTGELVNVQTLAKRGILATIACQNLPPRAAQQGFTIIQCIFVRFLGDTEVAARLPALLCALFSMFPLYFMARRYGSAAFANMVCGALAVTGFYLFYTTYGRGYVLAMTLYLTCVLVVLRIREKSTWMRWSTLSALFVLACYTHQACGLYLACLCLLLVLERSILAGSAGPRAVRILKSSVQPVVALGTAGAAFLVLYSVTIPSSVSYTNKISLITYYQSYHVNIRLLRVMTESWAIIRDCSPVAWAQAVLFAVGSLWALSRVRWVTVYLVMPAVLSVIFIRVNGYYVFTRYFLHFLPVYVLFGIYPVWMLLSKRPTAVRRAGITLVSVFLIVSGVLSLERLRAMERCGIRTAIEDAKAVMPGSVRIMGVLDSYVTVKHYCPSAVSAYKDKDFWKILNSGDLPDFAVVVPYLEYDIPGGWNAIRGKYELFKKYPSWLDVDDDQDSVYLYIVKDRGKGARDPGKRKEKDGV
jgi:hypothetical protein